MSANIEVFETYTDENGEEYYCPVEDGSHSRAAALDTDQCVESSTAGRYSGNLIVADRFSR